MAMIECPECKKEISDQALACVSCGVPIAPPQQEKAYCSKCGKDIDKEAVICPACGVPTTNFQQQPQQQAPAPINVTVSNVNTNSNVNTMTMGGAGIIGKPKNKWVALALCIFLGYFGAHKFYEGRTLMGIVYIFTVGLFFIGVLIDFFALLGKPNPYYVL